MHLRLDGRKMTKKTVNLQKESCIGQRESSSFHQKRKKRKHLLKSVSGTGGSIAFVMIKSGPTTAEPLMLQLA